MVRPRGCSRPWCVHSRRFAAGFSKSPCDGRRLHEGHAEVVFTGSRPTSSQCALLNGARPSSNNCRASAGTASAVSYPLGPACPKQFEHREPCSSLALQLGALGQPLTKRTMPLARTLFDVAAQFAARSPKAGKLKDGSTFLVASFWNFKSASWQHIPNRRLMWCSAPG